MGVQVDGTVGSVIDESKMYDKNSNDDDNEVLKIPTGQVNELNGNSIHKPFSEQVHLKSPSVYFNRNFLISYWVNISAT